MITPSYYALLWSFLLFPPSPCCRQLIWLHASDQRDAHPQMHRICNLNGVGTLTFSLPSHLHSFLSSRWAPSHTWWARLHSEMKWRSKFFILWEQGNWLKQRAHEYAVSRQIATKCTLHWIPYRKKFHWNLSFVISKFKFCLLLYFEKSLKISLYNWNPKIKNS